MHVYVQVEARNVVDASDDALLLGVVVGKYKKATGRLRKQNADSATNEEIIFFLSVTGKLNFLGHGVLPVAAYVASHYQQQRIGRLTVADMRELNSGSEGSAEPSAMLALPRPSFRL